MTEETYFRVLPKIQAVQYVDRPGDVFTWLVLNGLSVSNEGLVSDVWATGAPIYSDDPEAITFTIQGSIYVLEPGSWFVYEDPRFITMPDHIFQMVMRPLSVLPQELHPE